jgi:hypothetical protein
VNLDAKMAIVQGSMGIPLLEPEIQGIANICLQALNRHLVGVFTEVGKAHGITIAAGGEPTKAPESNQIEMPMETKKRGKRP